MALLPIFLKLEGREALIVGAGHVALEKAHSLLGARARLTVVGPNVYAAMRELAESGQVALHERAFVESDLDGKYLVIAATDQAAVNAEVYRLAGARGMLANSVDDPPHCDFYFGSAVRRGSLQIAISTAGESPALAQQLRAEIDARLPEDLGPWLEQLGRLRRQVLQTHAPGERRKALLHDLAERRLCGSPHCEARLIAAAPAPAAGRVYLVGAGPGDPELLTVRALRLLGRAEVVLHDDLVAPAILALASSSATIVNVGKRCGSTLVTQEQIHQQMIGHARQGRSVVRLKSGDPLLFGRAVEEIEALEQAGIAFEIVPGVSSAFAAAAAAKASLTSRSTASQVIFSTGRRSATRQGEPPLETESATRVVYMPGRDLRAQAETWLAEGLSPDLPCAVVSRASQAGEQMRCAPLGQLAALEPAEAPSLLLAGWSLWQSSKVRERLGAAQANRAASQVGARPGEQA